MLKIYHYFQHIKWGTRGKYSNVHKRKHIFLFLGLSRKRKQLENENLFDKYLITKLLVYRRFNKAVNNKIREHTSNQAESKILRSTWRWALETKSGWDFWNLTTKSRAASNDGSNE